MTFKSILCIAATAAVVAAAPLGDVASALRALTRDTKTIGATTAAVLEKHFMPKRLGQSSTPSTANVPGSLCGSDAKAAILFTNAAACQAYLAAPMLASTQGKFAGNCSASSLCLSFQRSLVSDFIGHPVVGVAGANVSYVKLSFRSADECKTAAAASNGDILCTGSVMEIMTQALAFAVAFNSSSLTTITWQV